MHRFFVPADAIADGRARLEGNVARQIRTVLRMSPGDEIVLLDDSGREYTTRIADVGRDTVDTVVLATCEGHGEPHLKVSLYQGVLKGEKFEWVLQKATELGVSAFTPVVCARTVPRLDEGWVRDRSARHIRIITEAAEQSGRCLLPELRPPMSFANACDRASDSGALSIIPWERETSTGLRSVLERSALEAVNVFVGPEGGLEETEVEYARSRGILPVSLGDRLLRAETAAIAVVAALLYRAGELGG